MTIRVRRQRSVTTAVLLLCTAVLLFFACTRGVVNWDRVDYLALTYLGFAMVLGVWAVLRSVSEAHVEDGRARNTGWMWAVLGVMLAVHAGIVSRELRWQDQSQIDCYIWQYDAVKILLSGHDPYGGTQTNIYSPLDTARFYGKGVVVNGKVQVGLPYPPVSLVSAAVGYELGDVRWTFILSVMVTAVCFFWLSGGLRGLVLAALLLLNPYTFFVERNCWTEPLVLMLLALSVVAAVKRAWWLPVVLGLFLVSKQFGLLAVPFGVFLVRGGEWRAAVRLMSKALGVAALTLLPFAIWNGRGLWHDLVVFHLKQSFRQDALSFAVPLRWIQAVGPVLLIAFVVAVILKGMRSPGLFAGAFGVGLLLFVGTSKQAAPNYYFLILNSLLCSVAALPGSALLLQDVPVTADSDEA